MNVTALNRLFFSRRIAPNLQILTASSSNLKLSKKQEVSLSESLSGRLTETFLITLDMLESDLTPYFIKNQPSFAPAFLMYSNIDTSQTKRLDSLNRP